MLYRYDRMCEMIEKSCLFDVFTVMMLSFKECILAVLIIAPVWTIQYIQRVVSVA